MNALLQERLKLIHEGHKRMVAEAGKIRQEAREFEKEHGYKIAYAARHKSDIESNIDVPGSELDPLR